MSRKSVMKKCNRNCGTDIYLSDESGKWLPYNKDNTLHECMKQQNAATKQEFTLDAVQKKLESFGVKLDLERLMK